MPKAVCRIRAALVYRREAFCRGLDAAGYDLAHDVAKPSPEDVLVTWNRYGGIDAEATRFEQSGGRVVVCENGFLGRRWHDGEWFAMAIGHHAGCGVWTDGGPQRWDSWNVRINPWRQNGTETVILGQRGIGESGIASPERWAEKTYAKIGGRIRPHPGNGEAAIPLEVDLAQARCVVTWASSAALKALLLGVPVFCELPGWIGAQACRALNEFASGPKQDDADRLAMFRRLAWAQWTLEEIASGEAFRRLLC